MKKSRIRSAFKFLGVALAVTISPSLVFSVAAYGSEELSPADYSMPEGEGFSYEVREELHAETGKSIEVFALTAQGVEDVFALNFGWLEVLPETNYLVRYQVRAEELEAEAEVYLQIRER